MTFDETIQKSPMAKLEPAPIFDPNRHIAPTVAHELNNILTIVQGYADRLLLRHSQNPTLMPDLKLISEAARRAATVVRNAKAASSMEPLRTNSRPAQVIG